MLQYADSEWAGQQERAKGVQYCVNERISHEKFVQVLKLQEELVRSTRRFESSNHVVSTIQQQRWALSCMDMKRAWVDSNTSLPYGHYRLDGGGPTIAKRHRLNRREHLDDSDDSGGIL